ncbi:hypothetical protein BDK51DRAFT_48800 [Blyttiomyces helicus]|uniref:DUF4472 domain-containing protein n=1 Tax=Blyttiomyces helicus TaxID=388810 RepID=A0A4V1IPY5_9FUNG|nr:hypothetical protein BDK51DRAFT_48800 [Blyttiomyces helicus]|eukprot:RKO84677.1 hypothetical protein BDK51DRAFT_48800 [Blyttiomyces helicus]
MVTRLLADEFSGNAATSFLVTINPSDGHALNVGVLEMAEMLGRIVTFPVRNDDNFQALCKRFRVKSQVAEHAIAADIESAKRELKEDGVRLIKASLPDPMARYVLAKRDNALLKEEAIKLRDRLGEITERFNGILDAKVKFEYSFARSEEEKQTVKKALQDAQIEHKKIVEESTAKRAELTNKAAALQRDIEQRQEKMAELDAHNIQLRKAVEELKTEKSEVSSEAGTLRTNYNNLSKEFQNVMTRNEEMGMEFINLINAKTALTKEKDDKIAEIGKLTKHNEFLQKRLEDQEYHGFEASSELHKLKKEADEARAGMANHKMEMEQKILLLERDRAAAEKSMVIRDPDGTGARAFQSRSHTSLIRILSPLAALASFPRQIEIAHQKEKALRDMIETHQKRIRTLETERAALKKELREVTRRLDLLSVEHEIAENTSKDKDLLEARMKERIQELIDQVGLDGSLFFEELARLPHRELSHEAGKM